MEQVKNIDAKNIPNKPGIYFWYANNFEANEIGKQIRIKIFDKRVCIYIGKTVNLRTRFKRHINLGYKAPRRSTLSWTLRSLLNQEKANQLIQNLYFDFFITDDIENKEILAIQKFNPILNLDDCINSAGSIISTKRKEYKAKHQDIWN